MNRMIDDPQGCADAIRGGDDNKARQIANELFLASCRACADYFASIADTGHWADDDIDYAATHRDENEALQQIAYDEPHPAEALQRYLFPEGEEIFSPALNLLTIDSGGVVLREATAIHATFCTADDCICKV